jgi:translocation and assembly module TamA
MWLHRSYPSLSRAAQALVCTAAFSFLLPTHGWSYDNLTFRLVGSDDQLQRDLEASSTLKTLEGDAEAEPGDVLAAAQGDYTRLVEVLYAQGYYSPVVTITLDGREAALIPPLSTPKSVRKVVVNVDPGEQFRFGVTNVGPEAPGSEPPVGFARNEPALATTVRDAAQGAVEGWRQAGHAKAAVSGQQITARHKPARLDVDVSVDPGPKLTFGEVLVTSESKVKAARIRQIAGIPRGETFDPDEVEKAGERLRETGTFRSVVVEEAEAPSVGDTLDILINVTDRKPRRFGAGVELSSTEGLLLSSYWLHRNIFGGAERFRIDGEVRQLGGQNGLKPDYEISARFEKPAVYGPDTLFFTTATIAYEEEPDYIQRTGEIGIGVTQEFSDTLVGELGFTLSRSEITDLYLPGDPVRTLNVFAMPAALTWDTRDVALDATEGFYVRAEAEPFTILSASEGGARLMFDARAYRGFGEDNSVVAAARVQFGALAGPEAADAPVDYLFYSGGGGTVRGQPYQSLDANYDGSGEWQAGAGLGVRYDTPVGPIRFDVAAPVTEDTADGVQFYIGIGQAF